ncbi:substrate-binding periplasmic protein [Bowmanella dokdonensis]|uniref:Transporter substrate-binding domain-containing protein n=1 Tax=Bowmanella dokdonensis TaxID=751969 RepID=A0A939DP04_9ALTE|nr:transporter substrate-binding domain-containing protein [Bowmanella dokdonensis]MBN7825717.1 transporter substrate-binding domain-containing protein [Bowmanella dokdonensis]
MRLILLMLWLAAIQAHGTDKVLLAMEDSWPPYAKSNGEGISREIVEAAYQAVGQPVEFVVVPYARALQMARTGEVDGVFNVTRQDTTEAVYQFGREPLLRAPASYFYPAGSTLDFTSAECIPDHTTVAVIIGYEYGDLYERHRHRFREVRVSSQQQIIQLLVRQRVQMAIMFDQVAAYYLREMGLQAHSIRKGKVNHISDIYVAFSRQRPKADQYMEQLDKGLQLLESKNQQESPVSPPVQ